MNSSLPAILFGAGIVFLVLSYFYPSSTSGWNEDKAKQLTDAGLRMQAEAYSKMGHEGHGHGHGNGAEPSNSGKSAKEEYEALKAELESYQSGGGWMRNLFFGLSILSLFAAFGVSFFGRAAGGR